MLFFLLLVGALGQDLCLTSNCPGCVKRNGSCTDLGKEACLARNGFAFCGDGMESEVPTFSPSMSPTESPSNSPDFNWWWDTTAPSASPDYWWMDTRAPSAAPDYGIESQVPSFSPTTIPSMSPTNSPDWGWWWDTKAPSAAPDYGMESEVPSFSPSMSPTESPTNSPDFNWWWDTKAPSSAPDYGMESEVPSFSPTTIPSMSPTNSPDWWTTYSPTTYPTKIADSCNWKCDYDVIIMGKSCEQASVGAPFHCRYCGYCKGQGSYPPTTIPSMSPTTSPGSIPTAEPTTRKCYFNFNEFSCRANGCWWVKNVKRCMEVQPTPFPTVYPTFHPTYLPTQMPVKSVCVTARNKKQCDAAGKCIWNKTIRLCSDAKPMMCSSFKDKKSCKQAAKNFKGDLLPEKACMWYGKPKSCTMKKETRCKKLDIKNEEECDALGCKSVFNKKSGRFRGCNGKIKPRG